MVGQQVGQWEDFKGQLAENLYYDNHMEKFVSY